MKPKIISKHGKKIQELEDCLKLLKLFASLIHATGTPSIKILISGWGQKFWTDVGIKNFVLNSVHCCALKIL